MTEARIRTVVAEAHGLGRRQDTGPYHRPTPVTGTHFVTLVKPEVLETADAADAMSEVVRVLREGEVNVLRCALVPARYFAERRYLLLHYPRLHRVAADGVHALCTAARREVRSLLDASGAVEVLGAFDAMTQDTDLSPAAIDDRCRRAGIHKLGSGSYASVLELNGRTVVVLNGFLPALVGQYDSPSALVGLVECHSPREVEDLRTHLLGALHPAAASSSSLRGTLHSLVDAQGLPPLSEGRNGVHLSAGHLEGMFQTWRYFAAADGEGVTSTALGRSLVDRGVSAAALAALAGDHNLTEDSGETVAPHGATEHLSRPAVLDLVRQWTATGKEVEA
ncbi:hypothetical protein ABZ348_19160 [Streptomyces sp. NPDC005963]|uniref:hypothetical protein n=1 Tax=Streptomyces sp. NPDC005963 TaxID=3156721 RepID=UPI0033F85A0E